MNVVLKALQRGLIDKENPIAVHVEAYLCGVVRDLRKQLVERPKEDRYAFEPHVARGLLAFNPIDWIPPQLPHDLEGIAETAVGAETAALVKRIGCLGREIEDDDELQEHASNETEEDLTRCDAETERGHEHPQQPWIR